MKKIYNELFYISKHGKIREKVVLARATVAVFVIVISLFAMSITAYAYFYANTTSASLTVRSASFETEVKVQLIDEDGNITKDVDSLTSDYKNYKFNDIEAGSYIVTVRPKSSDTMAKTGFVIVTAKNCQDTFHTQQLGTDRKASNGETNEIKFRVMITETTNLFIESHWGTSSHYPKFKDVNDEHYITYEDGEIKQIEIKVDNE